MQNKNNNSNLIMEKKRIKIIDSNLNIMMISKKKLNLENSQLIMYKKK